MIFTQMLQQESRDRSNVSLCSVAPHTAY
jgi:hypothetical protein